MWKLNFSIKQGISVHIFSVSFFPNKKEEIKINYVSLLIQQKKLALDWWAQNEGRASCLRDYLIHELGKQTNDQNQQGFKTVRAEKNKTKSKQKIKTINNNIQIKSPKKLSHRKFLQFHSGKKAYLNIPLSNVTFL